MTTQDHPTLDQVPRLARQLPPAGQAHLVARLTPTLAAVLEEYGAASVSAGDPRALLARLREDLRAEGPVSPSMAEDLAPARR